MKRIILIRSDKCTTSDGCEANFVFPSPIVMQPNQYATVQLLKCSFAHSYYLINEHTDKLVIDTHVYNLAHGNYSAASLLRYLHDVLDLEVRYSPSTYKFQLSDAFIFQLSSASTCLHVLGFSLEQCDTPVTSITGDYCADLHGLHSIKIITNFMLDSFDSSRPNGRDPHLLYRVPVENNAHEGSTFKYEHFIPAIEIKSKLFDRVISEFSAALYDSDNHKICFNGIPFTVKVALEIHEKQGEKIYHMIKNDTPFGTPHGESSEKEIGPSDGTQTSAVGDENAKARTKSPIRRKQRRKKKRKK